MRKFTKKQRELLDNVWVDVEQLNSMYARMIGILETYATDSLGIEIEIFHSDGEPVGFGDYGREYKLYEKS